MKAFALQYQPGVLLVHSNFYVIFAVFHTELLVSSQEYNIYVKPIFQFVQYIEYHCIRVQKIPALRVPVLNDFSYFSSTP